MGFLPIVGFFLVVLLFFTEVGDFTVAEGLIALCPGAWGVLEGVAVGADAIFADPRAIADPEAKPALVVLTVIDAEVPGFRLTTVINPV